MRKTRLGIAVTLALLGATHGSAVARSVCYQASGTVDETEIDDVLVLDVRFHSLLTHPRDARHLDVPVQTTYSAHGKIFVSPFGIDFAQGATITVAKHVGALLQAYDLALCSSDQASPTPEEWHCGEVTLTKVDPSTEERCDLFFLPQP